MRYNKNVFPKVFKGVVADGSKNTTAELIQFPKQEQDKEAIAFDMNKNYLGKVELSKVTINK